MTLDTFFGEQKEVALAFSGGVDSAYLLYAALQYATKVKAYYVNTPFQPEFELADARRLARELSADLEVLEYDVLTEKAVTENDKKRCYYCKKIIFSQILAKARADGFTVVLDGTNASDDAGDRPGMQALMEMQVLSPLRICGLTKAEIRSRSREAGLFTAEKPAYACLATRIPTDTPICQADLERVEQAEDALRAMGFVDFRVRLYHGAARIQVTESQFILAAEQKDRIMEQIGDFFAGVLLDCRTRG